MRSTSATLMIATWLMVGAAWAESDPEAQGGPDGWIFGRDSKVFLRDPDAVASRIGGWFDASYRDNDRQNGSTNLNHANMFFDTRFRGFQAFIEAEYENETRHSEFEDERQFELEQAFIRASSKRFGSLRVGRFNTPFGYWVPIHWSILMDTIEEPLHVGREWIPEQQVGLELAGQVFPDSWPGPDAELRWSLFAGGGSETLDQQSVKGVSFGGDLRLVLEDRMQIGTSFHHRRNAEHDDRGEWTGVLFGELKLAHRWTARAEALQQRRSGDLSDWEERDVWSAYAKLRWDVLPYLYLNYRLGYGADELERETANLWTNTFTIGIQPHDRVRVKLEYSRHDRANSHRPDTDIWGASLGVFF